MTLKVYRYDVESDTWTLAATVNDDATVDGDTTRAKQFRGIVDRLQDVEPNESEWLPDMKEVIERRYNNGYWATVRE